MYLNFKLLSVNSCGFRVEETEAEGSDSSTCDKSYSEDFEDHPTNNEYGSECFEEDVCENDNKNEKIKGCVSENEGEECEESIATDSNKSDSEKQENKNCPMVASQESLCDVSNHSAGFVIEKDSLQNMNDIVSEEEGEICEELVAESDSENSGLFFGSGENVNFSLPDVAIFEPGCTVEEKGEREEKEEKIEVVSKTNGKDFSIIMDMKKQENFS